MKQVNLEKVRKVEIEHSCYDYSTRIICEMTDLYDVINSLTSKGVKIINITYFE